jgi:hypothetical protein
VADVHPNTVDLKDNFLAQAGLTRRVGIAEYSFDRRYQAELVQNSGAADIPGVKNELYPRQCLVHAGPKQPMRVGDQSHDARF